MTWECGDKMAGIWELDVGDAGTARKKGEDFLCVTYTLFLLSPFIVTLQRYHITAKSLMTGSSLGLLLYKRKSY